MAQNSYAAFGLGTDDKNIATVDAGGVALAAIQGLSQLLDDKDARVSGLKKRIAALEKQAATEKSVIAQWHARLETLERLTSVMPRDPETGSAATRPH